MGRLTEIGLKRTARFLQPGGLLALRKRDYASLLFDLHAGILCRNCQKTR